MNLQNELNKLASQIAIFKEPAKISKGEWNEFAGNTVVALMAGGESSRYAAVVAGKKIQKNAHELPNGDTMIEMAIRTYRDAGFKKFVALVYHNAHTVKDRIGDGSDLGVEIQYSYDPDPPAGKGGAVRNAIDNGFFPLDKNLIVVNPDDIVFNFPENLARYIISAHITGTKHGMVATAAMMPGQIYPGTGLMVVDNAVVDTQMYPLIPVPLHVCATVFSAEALPRFINLFELNKKNDFEAVLFPILAAEKKLWSVCIDKGTVIQVNDLKAYRQLVEFLADKNG